jgi:hypothetical protein
MRASCFSSHPRQVRRDRPINVESPVTPPTVSIDAHTLEEAEKLLSLLVGRGVVDASAQVNPNYRKFSGPPKLSSASPRLSEVDRDILRIKSETEAEFLHALDEAGMRIDSKFPDLVFMKAADDRGLFNVALAASEIQARHDGSTLREIMKRRFIRYKSLAVPQDEAQAFSPLRYLLVGGVLAILILGFAWWLSNQAQK